MSICYVLDYTLKLQKLNKCYSAPNIYIDDKFGTVLKITFIKWNTDSSNGSAVGQYLSLKQIPKNLPQVESPAGMKENGYLRHFNMLKLSKAKITFMLCN